jgi:hypothetical protein
LHYARVQGSAEWVKLVAALYNKESDALKSFAYTERMMACATTRELDAEKKASSRVLWMSSYADWQTGKPIINLGKCTSPESPYYCEFAVKAGGSLVNYTALDILPDESGSFTPDQIVELCKSSDYIFYNGDWASFNASSISGCELVGAGKVYDTQASDAGGNIVFERKVAEPNLMLGDFAYIFEEAAHVELEMPAKAFLRNVATEAVATNSGELNPVCNTRALAAKALPALSRPCARDFFGNGDSSDSSAAASTPALHVFLAAAVAISIFGRFV